MGIRQTLNERPAVGVGLAAGMVVIALVIILWQVMGSRSGGRVRAFNPDQEFFSDDDGKTFFPESKAKLPPFMHNGKTAYVARVYRCGDKGTPFVGYLVKYTDEVRQRMDAELKAGTSPGAVGRIGNAGMLVKKPGQPKWVDRGQMEQYEKVTNIECPDKQEVESVRPGEQ